MNYEQFGGLKYKYRSREFWFKGYYIDMAGKKISKYNRIDVLGEIFTIHADSV